MIQRIQSVWLLLAAVLNGLLFYFNYYKGVVMINGAEVVKHLGAKNHFPSLLVAVICIAVPLIAIFMFKNRKKQKGMVALAMVLNIGFIAVMMMHITDFNNGTPIPTDTSYQLGAVLPIISFILMILALRGINKDQKLIKSLDRLR